MPADRWRYQLAIHSVPLSLSSIGAQRTVGSLTRLAGQLGAHGNSMPYAIFVEAHSDPLDGQMWFNVSGEAANRIRKLVPAEAGPACADIDLVFGLSPLCVAPVAYRNAADGLLSLAGLAGAPLHIRALRPICHRMRVCGQKGQEPSAARGLGPRVSAAFVATV